MNRPTDRHFASQGLIQTGLQILSLPVLLTALLTPVEAESVEKMILENGLTVLIQQDHSLPLVTVACMYRVGSANEAPGITGMAHYVEHMNFRGTENVSKADITGFVNRIGGRWNGYTSLDQTLYSSTVPAWALEETVRIESQRMSRSLFDPEAFERERTSVISELQGYENDPEIVLWDLGVATSFEIHPYRYNIIGWKCDVGRFSRDRAYRFYRDFYSPANAVVVLAGDLRTEQARKVVRKYFGEIEPSGKSSSVQVQEPVQRGEKTAVLVRPGAQPRTMLLYRAPEATHQDYPPLLVLDAILAGGRGPISFPGMTLASPDSRLEMAVRKVGARDAATAITPTKAPYVFALGASSDQAAQLGLLESVLAAELDRIADQAVSADELLQAKARLRMQRAVQKDRLADRAHELAYFQMLGSWELADSLATAVGEVGQEDLERVIRRWLKPTNRTIVRLVPGELELPEESTELQPSSRTPETVLPSPLPTEALTPPSRTTLQRQVARLENGVQVGVAESNSEAATIYIRLTLGTHLTPQEETLALLAARLITGQGDIRKALSELGVIWNAEAATSTLLGGGDFEMSLVFPSSNRERVLPQLGSLFLPRAFSPTEVDRAFQELSQEGVALTASPAWQAEAAAIRIAHPAWRPAYPPGEPGVSIRSDDVNRFCRKRWAGSALTIGLTGPGNSETWMQLASRAFAALPSGEQATSKRSRTEVPRAGEEHVRLPGLSQAEVVGVLPAVARDHPDYLPLRLLNYILGETGYAGRLGTTLVDTGLTYSVYSSIESTNLESIWVIRTGTDPARLELTVSTIRDTLKKLGQEGAQLWELREAQAFQLGRMVYDLDSDSTVARQLTETLLSGDDLFAFDSRAARILAVSLEQLNSAARKYLNPERLALGVAGPE